MMSWGTLALLTRALRSDAKSLRTHLFRFGFAGFLCLFLFVAQMQSLTIGAPGLEFFRLVAYLNFALITLAGIGFFASAITEEKEEETIGLLKMAGISRVGILLGKSTSRLLISALLLMIQLPFTLLAITLGGVTMMQIWSLYLALLAYLAMIANLALLASLVFRRTSTAAVATGGVVLTFLIGVPIAHAWLPTGSTESSPFAWAAAVVASLHDSSIVMRIDAIMTTGFSESAFSPQVLWNLGIAAVCFLVAWITFDRFTDAERGLVPVRAFLPRPTGLRLFRRLAPTRVWKNAVLWKDFHFFSGGVAMWLLKTVIYGTMVAIVAGFTLFDRYSLPELDTFSAVTAILMTVAVAVECSVYSAVVFQQELRGRTWPALAMLPGSLLGTIASKLAGCLCGLLPALGFLSSALVIGPMSAWDVVFSPITWICIGTFVIFLHLTMLLSLFLKWGALPLSIGIMIAFNLFYPVISIIVVIAMVTENSAFSRPLGVFFALIYTGFLTVPLQFGIYARLRHLATR